MSLSMSTEERESFLADLHVGIICINRSGKGPLSVPIWYDYEPGGDLWVMTNSNSIKGKLLSKTDRFSLCAQTEAPPYKYVSVEGPYTTSASTDEKLLHMAVRYLGEEQGRAYAASSASDDSSLIFSMQPETWLSVDYTKM